MYRMQWLSAEGVMDRAILFSKRYHTAEPDLAHNELHSPSFQRCASTQFTINRTTQQITYTHTEEYSRLHV